MPEIEITKMQRVKIEEGDILVATVPPGTSEQQLRSFRRQVTEDVAALGARVYVVAAEPGAVVFELVKEGDLADIYARLEKIEGHLDIP